MAKDFWSLLLINISVQTNSPHKEFIQVMTNDGSDDHLLDINIMIQDSRSGRSVFFTLKELESRPASYQASDLTTML